MPKKTAVFLPPLEKLSPEVMTRLLAISPYLHATLDLRKLLGMVMNVGVELTDADAASILLLNEATHQLQFEAATQMAISKEVIIPLDDSMAGWVVENGRSLRIANVDEDDRFASAVDKELLFGVCSLLAVPLCSDDGVCIGVLELINNKKVAKFSKQDQRAAEALAVQAVVAINNARRFAQSDLLAEIIHELKTPMMAISTATELLMRPDLPQEKHGDIVKMVRSESLRLGDMTQDFLEFARLESGRAKLVQEPLDFTALIQEIVSVAQLQAEARQIEIVTRLAEDLPNKASRQVVVGDRDRLKQVMLNLLSNAVKYNRDEGTITVSASVMAQEVCLSVSDTGLGIKPKDLKHLFERFYRVPDSEKGSDGSGLGLAITKKLVEQHNGRITVESVQGEGSTFIVYLPLTQK